jgi:hypothetical protein
MGQAPAVENLMSDTFEDLAEDKKIRAAIKSGCLDRLEGRLLLKGQVRGSRESDESNPANAESYSVLSFPLRSIILIKNVIPEPSEMMRIAGA